jgi:excisionase family DNA binding protein
MKKNSAELTAAVGESERTRRAIRRPGGGALQDTRELAAALGESERTIRSLYKSGVIPGLVLGYRTLRFKLPDVMAALERRSV